VFRFLSPGSNYCEPCRLFICKYFKAGSKLASLSRIAFPPVLLMSRRLRYLLRICRTLSKLAQQHIIPPKKTFSTFPQNVRKTLTALDPKVRPSVLLKDGTGFIIALVVDEKLLHVESHSLMLVNWRNISPSYFIRNSTFGIISTTDFSVNFKLQVVKTIFWNF